MRERRKTFRARTYFRGVIAFNRRASTMDCIVRNMSATGARVVFSNTVTVPDEVDLTIPQKQRTYRARLAWRTRDDAGVVFLNEIADNVPVPLEWARKLRACESEKAQLRQRVDQLSTTE